MKVSFNSIGDNTPPYVIAEIGHNHQGSLEQALEMIRAAAKAGANSVKLQKRNNRLLFTPDAWNEVYNSENAFGSTYGEHREALEFGHPEYLACLNEARSLGIDFFATAFDFESADFLNSLPIPFFKVASGDLRNLPLLDYIAKFHKPMIISTGGSNFTLIDNAVNTIRRHHNEFAILQCTASYPAKYEELNLRVIPRLKELYPENVIGYSGHENGIAMAVVAFTLGARVIEKHFTLNRALKGTDHPFSLEPEGMRKMIRDLNRAFVAMGDGNKKIFDSERSAIAKMGKMIIANRDLKLGHVISIADLDFRSPCHGLAPDELPKLLGKKITRDIKRFEPIVMELVE
jgi:sialic acid synthase